MIIRIKTATIFTLILLVNQMPTSFAQLGPPDVISSPLGRPFTISDSDSQSSNSPIIKFESSKKEPVYCLLDGIVVKAGSKDGNNGKDVELYHPYPGLSTITSNLGSICVKPGEQISRGQLLGYSEGNGPEQSQFIGFAVVDGSSYIKPVSFLNQVNQYVLKLRDSRKQTIRTDETRELEFLNSANIDLQKSNVKQMTPATWSALERQSISHLFERVRYSFPQFIRLARTSRQFKLLRVREILLTNGQDATAVTCNEYIVLSDKFFNETRNQFHCFCHELVHCADRYGFISYSKEWIDFVKPLIAEYKKNSTNERFTRWPGDYACTNTIEALAEYVSDYIAGKYFPSKSTFDTTIGATIFNPSEAQLKWCELVEQGDTQLKRGKHDESEALLAQAVKLFPEKPIPYHYLAVSRAKQDDLTGAIVYFNKFLSALNDLELDDADLIKGRYSHSLFENYRTTNANRNTEKLLDYFLQKLPNDAGFIKIRSKMNKMDIQR